MFPISCIKSLLCFLDMLCNAHIDDEFLQHFWLGCALHLDTSNLQQVGEAGYLTTSIRSRP